MTISFNGILLFINIQLFLLTPVESAADCDKSFIKGAPEAEWTYSSNKLKCKDTKKIELESKMYDELDCTTANGWVEKGKTQKLKDANADIPIQCKATQVPCDKSHIIGEAPTNFQFTNGELTCSDPNKEIKTNNKLYEKLECKATTGWTDGLTAATADITVTCVKKTCQQSYLTNYNSAEMDFSNKELKCKTAAKELEYDDNGKKRTNKLQCDNTHWNADSGNVKANTEKVTIDGCKWPACNQNLISGTGIVYSNNELTCAAGSDLKYNGQVYNKITCHPTNGWKADQTALKQATDTITVTCTAKEACTSNQITGFDGNTMTFIANKLNCKTNGQMLKYTKGTAQSMTTELQCGTDFWEEKQAAVFQSTGIAKYEKVTLNGCEYPKCAEGLITKTGGVTYTNNKITCPTNHEIWAEGTKRADLTCDSTNGWKDGTSPVIKQANEAIRIECKEKPKCQMSPPSGMDFTNGKLSCKEITVKKDKKNKQAVQFNNINYESLECDTTKSYWTGKGNQLSVSVHDTPTVTCIQYCQFPSPLPDYLNKPLNTFECDTLYAVKTADGKLGQVECTLDGGWKRGTDVIEPLSTTAVSLTCERGKCTSSSKSCLAAFIGVEDATAGYKCDKSKQFKSNDPNLIACDADSRTMVVRGSKVEFHDKSLSCHNDGSWYYSDDSQQSTPIVKQSDNNAFINCVFKGCNQCKEIPKLQGSGTPHTFTAGTKDTCAKAECTPNIWKIKEGNNEREYSGQIKCSSDSIGKWVLDDGVELNNAEVECLTTVRCEQAAELVSKCEPSWTDCTPITFDTTTNPGTYSCTTGQLYYKKASALNYEEGADSIQCVNTDGTWNVIQGASAVNKLNRGDDIVCAATNPVPTTTTTTPAPIIKACEVCPPVEPLLDCVECSDKKSDIEITEKADFSVCFATSLTIGAQFMTEKLNVVEGKLQCDNMLKIWVSNKTEVGKFAAYIESDEAPPEAQTSMIIGVSVGGSFLIIIVFVVILKVCICKRHAEIEKEDETKRKMMEDKEKRLKKQKPGDNDEILDGVAVDAPSELKL